MRPEVRFVNRTQETPGEIFFQGERGRIDEKEGRQNMPSTSRRFVIACHSDRNATALASTLICFSGSYSIDHLALGHQVLILHGA